MNRKYDRFTLALAVAIMIAASLTFGVTRAFSADATVTWAMPTKNTDGSTIPTSGAGSVASTRVEYGTCSGTAFGTKSGEVVVAAPAVSTVITGFAPLTTACFRAYAKNTYGVESGASNVASKTFSAPTPQPPTIVTVAQTAYLLKYKNGKTLLGAVAGTVPLNMPCLEGPIIIKGRKSYYSVPVVSVTPTPDADVVVAQCADRS